MVEITVYQGQHVEKGDQLGMFHFGGSTHFLMFRPKSASTSISTGRHPD